MFRREVEQMDAYLIALVMIFIGFLLQIYVWPRIPKSIFKYRGLVLSISLIILIFVVRIMREIDKTKPLYLKIDFGIRGQT